VVLPCIRYCQLQEDLRKSLLDSPVIYKQGVLTSGYLTPEVEWWLWYQNHAQHSQAKLESEAREWRDMLSFSLQLISDQSRLDLCMFVPIFYRPSSRKHCWNTSGTSYKVIVDLEQTRNMKTCRYFRCVHDGELSARNSIILVMYLRISKWKYIICIMLWWRQSDRRKTVLARQLGNYGNGRQSAGWRRKTIRPASVIFGVI